MYFGQTAEESQKATSGHNTLMYVRTYRGLKCNDHFIYIIHNQTVLKFAWIMIQGTRTTPCARVRSSRADISTQFIHPAHPVSVLSVDAS